MKSGRNVLLVEDEDGIRLTLRDFLQRQGYTVFVASDGVGAIKQLLDNDIDTVVTDYRMEGLDGDYWLRFLKSFFSEKRIIVTSGYVGPDLVLSFPLLPKPFDYDLLEHFLSGGFDHASPLLN